MIGPRPLARLVAVALLAALPGPAVADDLDTASAFVGVVRANGCSITEARAEALLPPAGLTMEDAVTAAAVLNRGALFTIDPDGATLRLVPDLCAADAEASHALLAAAAAAAPDRVEWLTLEERVDAALGAQLIGVIRDEGCVLTEARADDLLPPLGFDRDSVQDLVDVMISAGLATLDGPQAQQLALSPDLCAADARADADRFAAAIQGPDDAGPQDVTAAGAPPSAEHVTLMAYLHAGERGCRLDMAHPDRMRQTLIKEVLAAYVFDTPARDLRPAVTPLVDAFLTDPGPNWAIEPGRLRPLICTP